MQQNGQQESIVAAFLAELADYCGYTLQVKNSNEWSDLFYYTFPDVTDIAAGSTSQPVTVQIQNDSDFEWMASCYHYSLAEAAFTYSSQPIPNWKATIIETGSGKQLMNAPTPVDSIFGVPGRPIWLQQPKVFSRNSVIQMTIANFDAAVADGNFIATFIGRKLYNVPVPG